MIKPIASNIPPIHPITAELVGNFRLLVHNVAGVQRMLCKAFENKHVAN